jgi:hypothetical protein
MRDDDEGMLGDDRAPDTGLEHDGEGDDRDGDGNREQAGDGGTSDIGYGKPPAQHRFVKGRSGNPRGRPKGARGLRSDLKAELSGRVTVTEYGKKLKLTKQQVILKSLVAKAAKGDNAAASKVLELIMQMLGIEDERTGPAGLNTHEQAILESYLKGLGNLEGVDGDAAGQMPPGPAPACEPDTKSSDGEGE